MKAPCKQCGIMFEIQTGHYNRAIKVSGYVFCGRECAGLHRRSGKTIEQKKAEKAAYDKVYTAKNFERDKPKRAAYHKRTYDPVKAAIERKKKMYRHVEYCRRPEYKEYKKEYDKKYQAKKQVGEYWESYILLNELESKIEYSDSDKYQDGIVNKSQKRKRKWKN